VITQLRPRRTGSARHESWGGGRSRPWVHGLRELHATERDESGDERRDGSKAGYLPFAQWRVITVNWNSPVSQALGVRRMAARSESLRAV